MRSDGDSELEPGGDSTSRRTGIRVIGDLSWGAHICMFYETEEDLLDTALAYFEAGLESNELCVWAVSEPTTVEAATNALRRGVTDFDRYLASGQIAILEGYDWYLRGGEFDLQRVTGGWHAQLGAALARGYDGVRISGNAFWFVKNRWQDFREYEYQLDRSIAGHKMLVLCLYALGTSRAVDVMDVARAHQYSIARRRGEWEWLETPDLKLANQGADGVHRALDVLSNPFPGHDSLTPRERVALAHFVRGASNKEVGRVLGISPRTAEFHRSNIMRKLGAKNSVDLVRRVLGQR